MKKLFFCIIGMFITVHILALTPNNNGIYEISNASQLKEFAALVNSGNNRVSAILTNDIDMDRVVHTPIGNSKKVAFKGTFDGRFHKIMGLNIGSENDENVALFGFAGAGAKICNLLIDDLSSFHGQDHCASFVSQCSDDEPGWAEFYCLGTMADVYAYSSRSSKGHASGLVGMSDGNVGYKFTNCYNLGSVRGTVVGGMSCCAPRAICKSCFTVTNVKVQTSSTSSAKNPSPIGYVFINGVKDFVDDWGYNFFFGTNTVENFYPEITQSAKKWTDLSKPYVNNNHGVYKVLAADWSRTGQLCWFLNNCSEENPVWGQDLINDEYPTFLPGTPVVVKVDNGYKNNDSTIEGDKGNNDGDNNESDKNDATIIGKVYCDGSPVAGAQVSDGVNVTLTDKNGMYYLKSTKETGMVFVCNPKGYKYIIQNKEPQFYRRVDSKHPEVVEELNFELEKDLSSDHAVLMLADIQICGRIDDQFLFRDKSIPDINETISKLKGKGKDVYIMTLGDQSYNTYWKTKGIGIPETAAFMSGMNPDAVFNCMGNHDNDPDVAGDWEASAEYRQQWGPTYYSFNIGDFHYVVLDNILFDNHNKDNSYSVGLNNTMSKWLRKDLANVSKETPVVICMHAPLLSRPLCASANVLNKPSYRYDYGIKIGESVKGFKNVYVFTGHAHTCHTETYLNMKEYNVGAPGGNLWWTGYFTDNNFVCSDGAAGGYRVVETSGESIRTFYKSIGFDDDYQFRAYDLNNCHITAQKFAPSYKTPSDIDAWLSNGYGYDSSDYNLDGSAKIPNRILINVFGYDPEWKVEVFEEGRSLDVQQVNAYDPFSMISDGCQRFEKTGHNISGNPTLNSHMFIAQAASSSSTLTIKVTDDSGKVHSSIMQRPKNFSIEEYLPSKEMSSILEIDDNSEISIPEYYDLTGCKVKNPSKGIYIMRMGSTVKKIFVK